MSKREKTLLDAIQYLQELVNQSGMRNELIEQSKTKTIEIYEKVYQIFSPNKAKEIINISEQKILKLKMKGCCNSSASKNCLKQNPTQLSLYEQEMISILLSNKEFSHLPWNYIHSYAERESLLVMSLDSFYKYGKMLGFKPKYKNNEPPKEKFLSPKATYPFQILHMDSTQWTCENGERVFVHFIQDNYSKKILGSVMGYSTKMSDVVENLSKVIKENGLQNKTLELYCDDGPENQKDIDTYLTQNNFKIKKVIANYKTKKSNNSIEAWNKTFKQIILKKFKPKTADQMQELLPEMLDYYNNLYLPSRHSLTPNELVAGKTRKDLEKEIKVKNNLIKRLKDNRALCCCLKEAEDYSKYDCKAHLNKNKNNNCKTKYKNL